MSRWVEYLFNDQFFLEKREFFQKMAKSIFGEHDYFWEEGGVLLTQLL